MVRLLLSILIAFTFSAQSQAAYYLFGPPTVASVTGTSALAMAANSKRTYLIIFNSGANAAIVKFGSAQSGNEGITIIPGGYYEPYAAPGNSVWAKTTSSTTTLQIIQGQ